VSVDLGGDRNGAAFHLDGMAGRQSCRMMIAMPRINISPGAGVLAKKPL
jgi:hypothetical protein